MFNPDEFLSHIVDLEDCCPNIDEMFAPLVENGLDFLERSTVEFEEFPKYSVIHFAAAVELFLKARLIAKDWKLIVITKSEEEIVNRHSFELGDFQSVNLGGAFKNLAKNGWKVSKKEEAVFMKIGNHRNKMIHFFHRAHTAEESTALLTEIAREQLKAWYLLHRLLTDKWLNEFRDFVERFNNVDELFRKHKKFLEVVFEQKKPEIQELKTGGNYFFEKCPSCGFESFRHESEPQLHYAVDCMVCKFSEKHLRINCPKCDEIVDFVNEGFARCDCGKNFEPDDLVDILTEHNPAYYGKEAEDLGNCSECDGFHTVIQLDDQEKYICTSCFGEFNSLQSCGWCNEPNTGDMEFSYISGCNHCEGQAGWEADD
ncbi:MAG: hypothetical protein PHI11_09220 [Gallionella sp.]|nr:hypothetical protein [Gallionella sp.]